MRRSLLLAAGGTVLLVSLAAAQTPPATPEEHFASNVQPNLGFCRTCHVAGGIADVEDGRDFQLSANTGEDYARTQAAWVALGGGVDSSPLLLMPSDPALSHSGGKPWPAGSAAYEAMRTTLGCFDHPEGCLDGAGGGGGGGGEELPLLGNPGKRFFVTSICEGAPDETPIDWSQDPRRLLMGEN